MNANNSGHAPYVREIYRRLIAGLLQSNSCLLLQEIRILCSLLRCTNNTLSVPDAKRLPQKLEQAPKTDIESFNTFAPPFW